MLDKFLVIIVSVAVFGVLLFYLVKKIMQRKINILLKKKNLKNKR